MSYRTSDDNIYKEGSSMTSKASPELKLTIVRYYQRIYYCSVDGEPHRKHLAYFERELTPSVG